MKSLRFIYAVVLQKTLLDPQHETLERALKHNERKFKSSEKIYISA